MSTISGVPPPPQVPSATTTAPGAQPAPQQTVQPAGNAQPSSDNPQGGGQSTSGQAGRGQGGPAATSSGSSPAPPPPASGTIINLPAALSTLGVGDRILGTITARGADGVLTVQTPQGSLQILSSTALGPGAGVALVVRAAGLQPQVSVLPTAPGAAAGQGGVAQAPALAPGAQLNATVAQLAPGTPPTLQAITASGAQTGHSAALALGGQVRVQVTAVTPPGAQPAPPTAPLQGGLAGASPAVGGTALSGTVIGTIGNGPTVVQTPLGVLTVNTSAAPAIGATVQFSLLGVLAHAPATQQVTLHAHAPLASDWPALRETVAALGRTDPAAAQSVLASLPQPNTRLAASMMFLLAALGAGNARALLGERNTDALRRAGVGEVLGRLGEDFAVQQRLGDPNGPGEWRAFFLPFLTGERVEQIRLFLHKHKHRRGRPDQHGSRFVIEFELTELGPFQLDALVQDEEERRFDLFVRTQQGLPDEVRDGIGDVFTGTAGALGFGGTIVFQTVEQFPVAPLQDLPPTDPEGVDGVVV
ncbi:MAG: hypothetical protein QNJ92_12350 [Alphaproteobacteria bacterium]|nr:hypothetical protein [Alphaproteobacteria bacterium]